MDNTPPPSGKKPSGFGGMRLVFYALLAALIIASLMVGRSGNTPSWEQCKESLFQQMFSDQCTPRRGFEKPSSSPVPGGAGGQNV